MAQISHYIEINSSAESVFRAITTKKGLESWWTSDVQMLEDPKSYIFGFGNHTIFLKMESVLEQPNTKVHWHCIGELEEWTNTEVKFEISASEKYGTAVRFSHSGWKSTQRAFAKCNTDWGHLMYYLKDFVEGKNATPLMGS